MFPVCIVELHVTVNNMNILSVAQNYFNGECIRSSSKVPDTSV